jgi:PqqD family protein of HPr-rel-A system
VTVLQYCAPAPGGLINAELDDLTAIYHRQSGITHIVADPVPQILAVLADKPLTQATLLDELSIRFDVPNDQETHDALSARLDEMIEVGLVSHA